MKDDIYNHLSYVGFQILIDFYGCSTSLINDTEYVNDVLLQVAKIANLTVVNSTIHHFSPIGVSGVVVIEESHIAVHTWPEHQYVALDFFTCNQQYDLAKAIEFLKEKFQSTQVEQKSVQRGALERMKRFAEQKK